MKNKQKNSTFDLKENEKFDNFAQKWWNVKGELMALHLFNELRIPYILNSLNKDISTPKPLKNLNILDIGCGGGILSESLARAGSDVKAIDLADGPLSVAEIRRRETKLNISYEKCSTSELVDRGEKYDVITCLEMLEHVPEPLSLIHI